MAIHVIQSILATTGMEFIGTAVLCFMAYAQEITVRESVLSGLYLRIVTIEC
jgi:hypothetical protein